MRLVLDEKKLVERTLETGEITKNVYFMTRLMAMYYFEMGMDKKQVYENINSFLLKNSPSYNEVLYGDKIESIITSTKKKGNYRFKLVENVKITVSELDSIQAIKNKKLEQLAFTLLVYAKIYNSFYNNTTNWVNEQIKYIFKDANISCTKDKQGTMLYELKEKGLISTSKIIDCNNIRVDFVDEESETAIEITDFRNFVYEYLRHLGERIISCSKCSTLVKAKGNKTMYCKDCAKTIKNEQNREYRRKKAQRGK